MRFAAALLVLPCITLAVPAAAGNPEPSQAEEGKKAEAPKKVCRYVTEGMGSRRKKRLCLTEQQWIDFNRGQ